MCELVATGVAEEHRVLRFTISRRRSRIADNIGREVEDSAEGRGARSDYDSAKTTAGAA